MGIAVLDADHETVTILSELIDGLGQRAYGYTDKDGFLGGIDPDMHPIAVISDEYLEALEGTKQVYPSIEIVAIGHTATAKECICRGATHFLKKPFRAEEITQVLQVMLKSPALNGKDEGALIAEDPGMMKILEVVRKVAPTQAPILIQGESGTGKEVIARTIHRLSRRSQGPYVGVNLAAIPETLAESELFGFEKGAFTGAYASRVGRFEQAHKGTILLDEITEIGFGLQAKLLRVLQERQIDRVGGKQAIAVDFRVIATTNRDIEAEIREGRFRRDLFFRLNVIPLCIPPLRQRPGDIEKLAVHFVHKISSREQMPPKGLHPEALTALKAYAWPGNVRELENVIERAVILAEGEVLGPDDLLLGSDTAPDLRGPGLTGSTISEMERQLIFSTLHEVGGNRTRASELLGISIRTLRNKLNEYRQQGQNSDTLTVKPS